MVIPCRNVPCATIPAVFAYSATRQDVKSSSTWDVPGLEVKSHSVVMEDNVLLGLFVEIRTDDDRLVLTAYCAQHSLNRLEHYPTFPRDNEHPLGNETAILAKSMGISEEGFDLIYRYCHTLIK